MRDLPCSRQSAPQVYRVILTRSLWPAIVLINPRVGSWGLERLSYLPWVKWSVCCGTRSEPRSSTTPDAYLISCAAIPLSTVQVFSLTTFTLFTCFKRFWKIRTKSKTTKPSFLPRRGRDLSCSLALYRWSDCKRGLCSWKKLRHCHESAGVKSLLCLPGRSPARSPVAGQTLHHSTEDLRVRQSANYGRLCEFLLSPPRCSLFFWLGSLWSQYSYFHSRGGKAQGLSRILRHQKKSNIHPKPWAALIV